MNRTVSLVSSAVLIALLAGCSGSVTGQSNSNSISAGDLNGGASTESSTEQEVEAPQEETPEEEVNDAVLEDCFTYQTQFDEVKAAIDRGMKTDYSIFFMNELQKFQNNVPTRFSSPEFTREYKKLDEKVQTGNFLASGGWPEFLTDLNLICYKETGLRLTTN
jgi:hypothetical protein